MRAAGAVPDGADEVLDGAGGVLDGAVGVLGVPGGLVAALEAVLLTADAAVREEDLGAALGLAPARVRGALVALAQEYAAGQRGMALHESGAGWRLRARADLHPLVRRFALDGAGARLSPAALETLAVIAYRQPVTRARVAAVRGVDVHSVVRTLVARGLVEEAGEDPESGAATYATTDGFLEAVGMGSLADLPPLAPLLPGDDELAGLQDLLEQRS